MPSQWLQRLPGLHLPPSEHESEHQGDNVICSSFDRRLSWFDMDLSTKPYKTMRYNNTGLRSVSYHKRLPLFAAGGEVHPTPQRELFVDDQRVRIHLIIDMI